MLQPLSGFGTIVRPPLSWGPHQSKPEIPTFEVLVLHQQSFRQINHGTTKATQNTPANIQNRMIMPHLRTDQNSGRSGYPTSKHGWLLESSGQ